MGKKPIRQSIKPSFFKVLLGGFEKQLRIPPEFMKHVNEKLPGKFNFRSPNGTWWWVKVKKIKDGWFFRKGWSHFVRYHSLKVGEFLVFYYEGNSKFSVTIYDTSACEKEVPLAKRERNDHEEEKLNITTHFTKKAVRPGVSVGKKKRLGPHKIKINERLETEQPHLTRIWSPNLRYQTLPRCLVKKIKKETSISHSDDEDEPISEIGKEQTFTHFIKETRKKKRVDSVESSLSKKKKKKKKKKRIPAHKIEMNGEFETVCLLKTERPHFTQIMRKHSRLQITIPWAFGVQYGFIDKEMVELQDPQGRWWVVKIYRREDKSISLRTGLREFYEGNNLEEGDGCVFELIRIEGQKDAMGIQVHIFRSVEPRIAH
ncbi:hypothetical protein NE237_016486 [Protea cynaroides]|uniref:TF-B3 domain-containing protein n=1 Tax=Protea cynaroides TaxID=273540 RepID=A0A9Q0K6D8_9MAGN|nr:hypothetical protein NE237_016486 [Protea cynaroides]